VLGWCRKGAEPGQGHYRRYHGCGGNPGQPHHVLPTSDDGLRRRRPHRREVAVGSELDGPRLEGLGGALQEGGETRILIRTDQGVVLTVPVRRQVLRVRRPATGARIAA
jgi:hypothetical protein